MKLPKETIIKLLKRGDKDFFPHLSEQVNIEAYADKLERFADFKLIGTSDNILGCVAYYKNYPNSFLFVTHIWINRLCQRKGYGRFLLDKLINEEGAGVNELLLEVYKADETALSFYENLGFKAKEDRDDRILFSKKIRN